jgi:hypothetical protein
MCLTLTYRASMHKPLLLVSHVRTSSAIALLHD